MYVAISAMPATRPLAPIAAPRTVQGSVRTFRPQSRRMAPVYAQSKGVPAVQRMQKAAQDVMQAAAASINARKLLAAAVAAYVIVLPCCQGKPAAAFDQSPAVLSRGATVFGNNCATCHTGGQNIIESEKTLEKDALIENLTGGFNYEAIVTQVKNGKGQMPAWAESLSPEDIQAVAAYVYTQAEGNLWD